MDKRLKRNPHCVYVINYHPVWIPRCHCHKKLLVGPVEPRLKARLGESAQPYGFEILAHEVMPDHVQLFVSVPPDFSPAETVRYFKTIKPSPRAVSRSSFRAFAASTVIWYRIQRSMQIAIGADMLSERDATAELSIHLPMDTAECGWGDGIENVPKPIVTRNRIDANRLCGLWRPCGVPVRVAA